MNKKEIKEYLDRVDELREKLTDEDKDTLEWLIFGYNQCAKLLYEKEEKIKKALEIAEYGGIDGSHHKMWCIDQMVRALTPNYKKWVKQYEKGEDGEKTYKWDRGIAP